MNGQKDAQALHLVFPFPAGGLISRADFICRSKCQICTKLRQVWRKRQDHATSFIPLRVLINGHSKKVFVLI
ncbi:MAG: hypothetical protein U0Z53_28645 [Blastocatellia bacterium]